MHPFITLYRTIGAVMIAYGIGVIMTPNGGAVAYMVNQIHILTPTLIAIIFLVCGITVFFTHARPQFVGLLTTPILMYAIASVFFFMQADLAFASAPAIAAHAGLWFVTQAALIEKARDEPWIS